VFGFRRDGAASFYFGGDRVYHFSADAKLRRAFVGGLLYKAQGQRLASLARRRTAEAVELVRHDLSEAHEQAFLAEAAQHLERLRGSIEAQDYRLVGQVPEGSDVILRARQWLTGLGGRVAVADSPRAS
jgi:hypothetical protein